VTTHVLEADGLRRSFGELLAVDDVTFHIAEGETYGLLGPNGAGKTTTISMVCGLLEPDAGHVTICGEAMATTARATKRHLGYVPQDLAVYPDLTGRENLRFFGRVQGLSRDELSARVDDVLEVVGLDDRADDRVEEYSGGMKRRLNIGVGLLHRPRLLLLDEPTVGVDPQSRNAILESVARLAGAGMSVLYTTHYMEEAERLCDRVGIIDGGRLEAEGTRRELVARTGGHDRVLVTGRGDLAGAAREVQALPAVGEAVVTEGAVDIALADAGANLAGLLAAVGRGGMEVTGVEVREPDLEAVFLHLTGRALRD
jgi:ABC-2 type transport system ATP-binding protein